MIKEALEYLADLGEPKIIEAAGLVHSSKEIFPVLHPEAATIKVTRHQGNFPGPASGGGYHQGNQPDGPGPVFKGQPGRNKE